MLGRVTLTFKGMIHALMTLFFKLLGSFIFFFLFQMAVPRKAKLIPDEKYQKYSQGLERKIGVEIITNNSYNNI